jgi:hypothetical protein
VKKTTLQEIYTEMRNVPTLFKETIMSSSFIAERQCDIEAPGGPGYTLNQSKIDSTHG